MIAASIKDFSLSTFLLLTSCHGISTDDLATCRILREVELRRECIVEDLGDDDWLRYFPATLAPMLSFGFSCLDSEISLLDSEHLVSRLPTLKSLKLHEEVTLHGLESLLLRAPQLGTCSFSAQQKPEAFSDCKQLKSFLSGLWDILPEYLQTLYVECAGLTSYATVRTQDLVEPVSRSPELHKLWVMDLIQHKGLKCFSLCVIEPVAPDYKTHEPLGEGLKTIAEECKDLQRLCVSGLLADIGKHAKKLDGDRDLGLYHLFPPGCGRLRKLEIVRDCSFGDTAALLLQFLWMLFCLVSSGACKLLSQKMPMLLNVKVIGGHDPPYSRPESSLVERLDMPDFVWTI